MDTLQRFRRPDLYDPSWNCVLCSSDKETWKHLWTCPGLIDHMTALRDVLRDQLFAQLEEFLTPTLKAQLLPRWNDMPFWAMPTDASSSFTFDFLFRGFIPVALITFMSSYMPKSEAQLCISFSLDIIHGFFKEDIWSFRCKEMAKFEAAHNITNSAKRSCSTSHVTHVKSPPQVRSVPQDLWKE